MDRPSILVKGKVMDTMQKKAFDAAVAEYFANGGKVTVCPVNERTEDLEVNIWKRGPGRPAKEKVDKD
jgi:hypothetical protein